MLENARAPGAGAVSRLATGLLLGLAGRALAFGLVAFFATGVIGSVVATGATTGAESVLDFFSVLRPDIAASFFSS